MVFHKNKKQSKRVLQTERAIKAESDFRIQQNLGFTANKILEGENCQKNHQNEQEKMGDI